MNASVAAMIVAIPILIVLAMLGNPFIH